MCITSSDQDMRLNWGGGVTQMSKSSKERPTMLADMDTIGAGKSERACLSPLDGYTQ